MHTLEDSRRPERMELNDLGVVRLRLAEPLAVDPYERNRATGAFILIDEATNDTVGAGHGDRRVVSEPSARRRSVSRPGRDRLARAALQPERDRPAVVLAIATGWWWLLALLALQLAVGLTLGRRYCLPCVAYFELVQPRFGEGPLEDSRPPRVANMVGFGC